MARLFVIALFCAFAVAAQAQQTEFAVMRTDRVTLSTGESTHLNCSIVGTGNAAQLNCESNTSGNGIPLVYHVALVVGSDKVGYVISCGGGLVRRIGCQPLAAGQVVMGSVDGGKLHVSVGSKTRTYRIETSAYIGPLREGSPDASTSSTTTTPSTAPHPSVKLAAHNETTGGSSSNAGQPDQPPGSPASTAKVMISSEPTGGDIYVDGNFVGNTPSVIDLPAGSHAIRVEAKGQKPWNRTVTFSAGSSVTLQALLGPERN
jgi:hypothetical protein